MNEKFHFNILLGIALLLFVYLFHFICKSYLIKLRIGFSFIIIALKT